MYLHNGKKILPGWPFAIGEGADRIQYPANWLEMASQQELEAIGITQVDDPVRPDDNYYQVTENEDGTFTAEPKPLDGLKTWLIGEVKATAAAFLQPTSWMVERAVDPSSGKPVPPEVLNYRAAVRVASDRAEAAINACASVEALAALVIEWPEVPA